MESIYSSKLYKASTRKDRIQAALLSPGNQGLVQQLAKDLGEEYKTKQNLGIDDKEVPAEPEDPNSLFVKEEVDPEKDLVTVDDMKKSSPRRSSSPGRSSHSSSGPSKDSEPDNPSEGKPSPDDSKPDSESKPEPESAEASTKITSSSEVNLTILKDSLNSREDTAGVARVAEKENEIWIYYSDDVNLNNIMTEVIEYLMNSGYLTLVFNRLARSDNAIVFLNECTTEIPIQELTAKAK